MNAYDQFQPSHIYH